MTAILVYLDRDAGRVVRYINRLCTHEAVLVDEPEVPLANILAAFRANPPSEHKAETRYASRRHPGERS